jgi:tRNA A37 threonylcarbamoyladenosine synthetase subunit TsaC/SUA5/YrdC
MSELAQTIGQVGALGSEGITYVYRGDEVLPIGEDGIPDLSAVSIDGSEVAHYTDNREDYEEAVAELTDFFTSRTVDIAMPDGSYKRLLTPDEIMPFVDAVDGEYAETVTPRLQKITGSPETKVPTLKPELVYASYVALSAGGSVVLPTSVGNIVGSASPRGLSTMFAVKERPMSKPGVVLTTMDQIPELAQIPEGWKGYLEHMHRQGVLVGSKLLRNPAHPLIQAQPEWSQENSSQVDGTSMFVFLPGPYSDVTARILARDNVLLTASSANKSGEGNNRDIATLHPDIKRGVEFVASDPEAVDAYPLDEEVESQGVMVDFRPQEDGTPRFHVIRMGFMQGAFDLQSRAYIDRHDELGLTGGIGTFDFDNKAHVANQR